MSSKVSNIPVGWALPFDEAMARANAYLRATNGHGWVADPDMSFRNLFLGLWIVNFIDPDETDDVICGGSVLVVPNEGDVYESSANPGSEEFVGAMSAAEEAGLPSHWLEVVSEDLSETYWRDLLGFVESERRGHVVYPPADQVFRAFEFFDFRQTRVVIFGQDPYHGPQQADGLCFSVPAHLPKKPPSLVNMLTVLKADWDATLPSGSLEGWADQGVLLLNTVLTVREGEPGSHRGKGWEDFTDSVIRSLNDLDHRVIFILWGNAAKKKRKLIDESGPHRVLESSHPSPFSAYRGFLASTPFSGTNALLAEVGPEQIDWSRASSAH